MIQTDADILLVFASPSNISATLNLTNPLPHLVASFKIKTTKPDIFSVTPTKGFLGTNKTKVIDISLIGEHTLEQVKQIVAKEKFMIEYIPLVDKTKQQDLEEEWKKAHKEEAIKKIKLKMRIEIGTGKKASDLIFEDEGVKREEEPLFKSTYSKEPPQHQNKHTQYASHKTQQPQQKPQSPSQQQNPQPPKESPQSQEKNPQKPFQPSRVAIVEPLVPKENSPLEHQTLPKREEGRPVPPNQQNVRNISIVVALLVIILIWLASSSRSEAAHQITLSDTAPADSP